VRTGKKATADPSTTLRSGRDDNSFARKQGLSSRIWVNRTNKIVIPTGAQRSGGICGGFFPGSHADSKAPQLLFAVHVAGIPEAL
jgi:hypothetical protein